MNFQGKRVLVTGGAGFIGSHLTDRLVELGASVIVLDDFSTGRRSNLKQSINRVRVIRQDLTSRRVLEQFRNVDIIFHLAAGHLLSSFKLPDRDLQINATGTLQIIEIARKSDATLVYASTGSVYGNPNSIPITEDAPLSPISPYAVSKLTGEFYVRLASKTYSMPTVCLRYFNVYGPRQRLEKGIGVIPRFVKQALRMEPLTIFGTGGQTRDFTYISDIVDSTLAATEASKFNGVTLNIGTGEECSILALAQMIIEICNSSSSTVFEPRKIGDIDRLCADISRARRILGYVPSVSLKNGIEWLVKYMKDTRTLSRLRKMS